MVLFSKLRLTKNINHAKNIINLKYNFIPSTNCKIQLLTPEYFEAALDLTEKVFIPNEKICKAMKISEHPEAAKEWMEIPRETAKQGISLITLHQKPKKISAITYNVIYVKNDEFYEKILATCKHPITRGYLQYFADAMLKIDLFASTKSESAFEPVMSCTAPEFSGKRLQHHLNEVTLDLAYKLAKCDDKQSVLIDGNEVYLEKKPEIYTQMPSSKIFKYMAENTNRSTLMKVISYDDFEFKGRPMSEILPDGDEKKLYVYYKRLVEKEESKNS